jgi:iron transport multicopper oxidase
MRAIAQPIATKTISLEDESASMDDGTNHAIFNGITYNPPLVQAMFSELRTQPSHQCMDR